MASEFTVRPTTANDEAGFHRPWPTRNTFWNLAIFMTCFAALVCAVFPFLTTALGVTTELAISATFVLACVVSGFITGLADYLLVAHAVRRRLGALSARLSGAEHELIERAGTDTWQPLAQRYTLPTDSDDEFGRTNASFNYLLGALDTSHHTEHALRQHLIEQAKLAALATLTAGVAHEMKNPLNFVVNFTELNLELCDELRQHTPPEHHDTLTDVENNLKLVTHHSNRALAVMSTMLTIGRTHTDDDATTCHLNHIVEHSTTLAEHTWKPNHPNTPYTITITPDPTNPTVHGFEIDLIQAIVNLVTNALDALTTNPTTDQTTNHITITTHHDTTTAHITITDTGPGIDPHTLPHIYEPFFTTKNRTTATGLGLTITKDIIDNRHHGHLHTTTTNTGTQVTIGLPLSTPTRAQTSAQS